MRGSFKLGWFLSQISNIKAIRRHFSILKNPMNYYVGCLMYLIPGLRKKPFTLLFKNGHKIKIIDFMSFFIYNEIFVEECYDVSLENSRNPIIVDVGANTGFFALRMKQLYPDSIIYCFEPYPPCIEILLETIQINKLTNVFVKPIAVSDEPGMSKLFIHPTNIGGHSLYAKNVSENYVDIKTINLVELLEILDDNRDCELLKLDCEGSEYNIIKSMDSKIAKSIQNIIYEPTYEEYDIENLNEYLRSIGYSVKVFQSLYLGRLKTNDILN